VWGGGVTFSNNRHAAFKPDTILCNHAAKIYLNAAEMGSQLMRYRSMGMDGVLYDYHEGAIHLAAKKVAFVGKGRERMEEDYLRILRHAPRFFRFQVRIFSTDTSVLAVWQCLLNLVCVWQIFWVGLFLTLEPCDITCATDCTHTPKKLCLERSKKKNMPKT
jgi:hypothetical protein